jgi:hypothetical protein
MARQGSHRVHDIMAGFDERNTGNAEGRILKEKATLKLPWKSILLWLLALEKRGRPIHRHCVRLIGSY